MNIIESNNMLRVGVVSSTHGVKGEVKIYPTTDDAKRYEKLEKVFVDLNQNKLGKAKCSIEILEIEKVRYFKQFVIAKFKDIDDINDVEKYKGLDLYVDRKDAVELEENEFFISDLIGLEVIDDEDRKIGVVSDVIQTGANDVYQVDSDVYGKQLMLPAIKDCVLEVNPDQGYMKVHIMEGLLEL